MNTPVTSQIKRDHIMNLLADGRRTEGRSLEDIRDLKIEIGLIESADGSAKVCLGDTVVICGVKMVPGTPYSDAPASGTITTGAELIPMAHPMFESGPPGPDAIELARVVDRGIRESGMVDVDALCIIEGEEIWMCYIDIYAINYDGNLFDACNIAAVSALKNTVIPAVQYGKGKDSPLPTTCIPVSITEAKIGNDLIVDPDFDEEAISSARLTVTTDENGNFRAMQKGGKGSISRDELSLCLDRAVEKGREIRKIIG